MSGKNTGTAGTPQPSGTDAELLAGVSFEEGDMPPVKGRGRPAAEIPADLVAGLEASIQKGFVQKFGTDKELARIKAQANRWGERRTDGAAKVKFVSVEKDGEKGLAMKAKVLESVSAE